MRTLVLLALAVSQTCEKENVLRSLLRKVTDLADMRYMETVSRTDSPQSSILQELGFHEVPIAPYEQHIDVERCYDADQQSGSRSHVIEVRRKPANNALKYKSMYLDTAGFW